MLLCFQESNLKVLEIFLLWLRAQIPTFFPAFDEVITHDANGERSGGKKQDQGTFFSLSFYEAGDGFFCHSMPDKYRADKEILCAVYPAIFCIIQGWWALSLL